MTPLAGLILRILSLAMLYIFLGIAIWMLWRAVSAKEASAGRIAIPSISLVTDEDGKREELSFTRQEVSIGRSPESDFRLDNHTVSARHGRLNYHLNQWWYEDLNSTNGSFLQGTTRRSNKCSPKKRLKKENEKRCKQQKHFWGKSASK